MLVQTHVLPERMEYLDRVLPWLEPTLVGRPDNDARLIRPYAQWHLLHRARRRAQRRDVDDTHFARSSSCSTPSTRRSSPWSRCNNTTWTVGSLSGPRAGIVPGGFIAWAVHKGIAAEVAIPAPRVGQPSAFAENDDYLDQLRRCLTDAAIPTDLRAGGTLILLTGKC
jgi:hypothetical protein